MHVLWSSVSSSETSSAATFTQSPLRLDASRACHCNAGTRPRSSSMEGRNSSAMLRTTPIDSSTNRLISSTFFGSADSSLPRIRFDRFAISTSTAVSACPTSSCSSREIEDSQSIAILKEVVGSVQEHHQMLLDLIRDRRPLAPAFPAEAQLALDQLMTARRGARPNTPDWIGDAIYGVNDGLGAIFGIVSGVSGATLGNSHFVLLAGMAGMVASALS